jgi:glucose-6-phosphate isomerase
MLKDKNASGPDILYAIAMDTGKREHLENLRARNLLYGICLYASGRIGREPVRSQGHIHAASASCGCSTPELYEILHGTAYILMQKGADIRTKDAFAVRCSAGDKVLVPPGYAHCTINADPASHMVFGAWCVRDYGFDYRDVRGMGGLSYYPVINESGEIVFEPNPSYPETRLIVKEPGAYTEFNIVAGIPIYSQYEADSTSFDFVTSPQKYAELWGSLMP